MLYAYRYSNIEVSGWRRLKIFVRHPQQRFRRHFGFNIGFIFPSLCLTSRSLVTMTIVLPSYIIHVHFAKKVMVKPCTFDGSRLSLDLKKIERPRPLLWEAGATSRLLIFWIMSIILWCLYFISFCIS